MVSFLIDLKLMEIEFPMKMGKEDNLLKKYIHFKHI